MVAVLFAAADGHHADVGFFEPILDIHLAAIDEVVRFRLTHVSFSFPYLNLARSPCAGSHSERLNLFNTGVHRRCRIIDSPRIRHFVPA
jgi:isocitrate dehydrogenase kinase/phosphatase